MKSFASDNYAGVLPEIMEALTKANTQHARSYGTVDQRAKALLNFCVACGTEGGDAAAVKGFFVNHDGRLFNAFVVTEFARQFDGRLVGFEA
mgnify:CR=1 FL=1